VLPLPTGLHLNQLDEDVKLPTCFPNPVFETSDPRQTPQVVLHGHGVLAVSLPLSEEAIHA
jgi:hypothetical protein